MLQTLTIPCPKCQNKTEIAVSSNKGSGFTSTSCRHCRAGFITKTQKDGRILILDRDAAMDPTGGESVRVLATIEPASRSGYRVQAPDHLGIFDRGRPRPQATPRAGVSDEELSTAIAVSGNVLWRPDGSPRPPAEAAKYVGWRAVWVAQLNDALQERIAGPPPLSFPPTIFISYRWGMPSENEWAAALARELRTRGYPVVFDREEPTDLDVPDLVSKIADCRYFLALLDDGYAERVGRGQESESTKDGWVFDEYNTAAHLEQQKQIRILGLLRSGSTLPRGFSHPRPGRPGNTLDVRTPQQLKLVLDDVFPPIQPSLDDSTVEKARSYLRDSHELVCAGRFEEAFAAAEALTDLLPGVIDGPAQKIRVALHAGWAEKGLAATEEAIALAPESRELLLAGGMLAGDGGYHKRSIELLAAMLEAHGHERTPEIAQARHALGSSLDDVGEVYPAIAHLEIARAITPGAPDVLNTLGFVYRRVGDFEAAIACFEEGLAHDASNAALLENLVAALAECGRFDEARKALDKLVERAPGLHSLPGLRAFLQKLKPGSPPPRLVRCVPAAKDFTWVTCTECPARIPLARGTLCARCGSSLTDHKPRPCPHCGSAGRVLLGGSVDIPSMCPYCRHGQVSLHGPG